MENYPPKFINDTTKALPPSEFPRYGEKPMQCPHCGSGLLWSEDRGAHCDGCEDYDAAREDAAMTMELGPPISTENKEPTGR